MLTLRRTPRPFARWYPPRAPATETVFVSTGDGARLAIHRVRPPRPDASVNAVKPPVVMLLHGLGANRFGWLLPQRSFAVWLASRGFDVYVPELRGAGESVAPRFGWDLDDYLSEDLPAILRGIRETSGQHEVHWVGHSMGGVLLCCYAIRNHDHGVRSGVAIGSALDYRVGQSGFQRLYAARAVIERLPAVPFGAFSHLIAPLLGRVETPIEAFNFSTRNVEPEVVRAVYASAFEWIPMSLLKSLATTFDEGGLRSRDGAVRYLECASRFTAPLLLLGGTADVQCPVEAVHATARTLGADATAACFGRAHGHAEDYGHFDLIVGRRAPDEVWPRIERFLRETGATATRA